MRLLMLCCLLIACEGDKDDGKDPDVVPPDEDTDTDVETDESDEDTDVDTDDSDTIVDTDLPPDTDETDGAPDTDETDVVVPDTDETDVVAPDTDETDVVVPDTDETDVVVPDTDETDVVVPDTDETLLPDTADSDETSPPDPPDTGETDLPDPPDTDETDLPTDSDDPRESVAESVPTSIDDTRESLPRSESTPLGDDTQPAETDDSSPPDTRPPESIAPDDTGRRHDSQESTWLGEDTTSGWHSGETGEETDPVDSHESWWDSASGWDSEESLAPNEETGRRDSGGSSPSDTAGQESDDTFGGDTRDSTLSIDDTARVSDSRGSRHSGGDTHDGDSNEVDTGPHDTDDTDLPVETDPAETDPAETDPADTDPSADTAYDSGAETAIPCVDAAWWPADDLDGDGAGDLPYRVLVHPVAPADPIGAAPLYVDLDFRALLDSLGDSSALDPASIRVVLQDCAHGQPELPSQYLDRLIDLPAKLDHLSPAGDERGTVMFLYDEDGDPLTREITTSAPTYGVYFSSLGRSGGALPAPAYADRVSAGPASLDNGLSSATFDPARGGLLAAFSQPGSPELTSQSRACCGNSMFLSAQLGWLADPMDGPGAVEIVEDGPLLSALRATGSREMSLLGAPVGAYDYEVLYWLVAGRPELFHVLTHTTTMDSVSDHIVDASQGFRPWESVQTELLRSGALSYEEDMGEGWAAITAPVWGVAVGFSHRPRYLTEIANPLPRVQPGFFFDHLAMFGNDWIDNGGGTPTMVPDGTAYFDHIGLVVLPYQGPFTDVRGELLGAMSFVEVLRGPPEAR